MSVAQAEPILKTPAIDTDKTPYFNFVTQNIEFNQHQYRLFIAIPKQTNGPTPVLYLLDGNTQFPYAVNSVKTDRTLPIIVGIGYNTDLSQVIAERTRDYTIPASGERFSKGGQAANFLAFITQKVKPSIEATYLIDKEKEYFFGHSFGGLFGLYVLFNQPELFDHYIIASPSLWWGNGAIIPKQQPWVSLSPQSILVTFGEYEEHPELDPNMYKKRLEKIKHRQHFLTTREFASQLKMQGLPVQFELIRQADHGAVIQPSIQATIEKIQK
ncbi:alpha/beta hydrolase [Mannheimia massilioguelmaensis]|uniref:alpha/beta hydrolase n=1 Tax=Mannheimia massilioguelmaensis TaxID=1604354 RepID=UPI000698A6EE|nr:alpha/beta hydrolase-fold protein [Mannheimia massilioguelmaensis]